MFKNSKITQLTLLVLAILLISALPVNATNQTENNSVDLNFSSRIGYPLPPVNLGPHIFEYQETRPEFMSHRGTFPVLNETGPGYEWIFSVARSSENLSSDLGPYMQKSDGSGGPITKLGATGGGYIDITMNSTQYQDITESDVDAMYGIINRHCEEMVGIKDVPAVFLWDKAIENTKNESFINETVNIEKTGKETSGFSSLMSIPIFAILLLFKTKKE
ncbi:hypothetical protein [Methanolobus vulcani]|uniref:Uncharacterized protein n=1 Tax=Methanolobus vulcani TaxID=38026 RepID=A0A7Z8KM95_9EURY|nr:hypothetical protein [Methanolobus vulcani]TQD24348.1 hypothetical protein FKV42_10415 [Methanolobus vulcani]